MAGGGVKIISSDNSDSLPREFRVTADIKKHMKQINRVY